MEKVPDELKCQYNYLGKSGLRVSNICLGAMTFGPSHLDFPNQLNEADSHALINRYVEWGGNFIDTANIYGKGNSERIVGSWLATQERDRFVVATKVFGYMDRTNPNDNGLGRRHIVHSIEESLKRLQTDYVDLYQIHMWDRATPVRETLLTLNDLVRCGKVRYMGASNVTGWQLQKIVDLSERLDLNPFISLQQQYSLVSRDSELEPFQVCRLNGLGVLPWSPLKGGLLTGKYTKDHKPEDGRVGWVEGDTKRAGEAMPSWSSLQGNQQVWALLDKMAEIAQSHGKSVAQVSLRWLLQKKIVTSVIIGATKVSQLDDNMGAANGWELSKEEMTELDEASKPNIPYPYSFISMGNESRFNPWNDSGDM